MSRRTRELLFPNNRTVTEYMRDNGLDDQETRKEYAMMARYGYWRTWSVGTTGYSVTHDGATYIVRISEDS